MKFTIFRDESNQQAIASGHFALAGADKIWLQMEKLLANSYFHDKKLVLDIHDYCILVLK